MYRPADFKLPHRPLLATALVALAAFSLPLRAEPTDDEQKSLKLAEQSYKDGAFDLCSDRVATLLKKYPKTELLPQAELLQASALYQLGRSDAAFAALNLPIDQVPAELRGDTLFWQAESLLDLGKWPDAEQKYRALLVMPNSGDKVDDANLGLAWALYKEGKEADALTILQALVKDKGQSPAGRKAQLFLAKIQLSKKQFKDAIAALQALLGTNPEPGLAFQTNYWLGEAYFSNNQPDLAATAYHKITDDPKAFPKPLVAEAWLGLGRSEHVLHQDDQAMLAYEQTYHLTENEPTRLEAFRSYLESARAGQRLPEAVTTLQEFAKTSDRSAPAALFAIGTVLAEDGSDDRAIGILESLLVAYSTSPWVPSANYQLGQLYAHTNKPDQAIKALQNCISTSMDPELVRSARFQLGYVLLNQTKDYAGAAAQFSQITDGVDAAAENAGYNLLLALAYERKLDAFTKAKADFDKRFPKNSHAKQIALAQGQLLANAGKPDDAKAAYRNAIALPGGGPDQLELLKSLSDLQYQTGDLDGTVATCQAIVSQFPDSALPAAQRSVLVSYEMKKLTDDQVEQALIALNQKYAKATGAPEAYFQLGEFYYDRQDYVKAQDAFQQLTVNYPDSSDVDAAYFLAGRSAFAHQDFTAARTFLDKVPDGSPLKPDARLWTGRVLQEQLKPDLSNFVQAITYYDAVLATEKTGPRFVEAALQKGQCLFALGPSDPSNYAKCLATYSLILNSKEGTVADRDQAAVSSAKCLEQMGKREDAMALYLDVLGGRIAVADATAPPEYYWQIKAGWEAGRIREDQKDWRGAIEIYKRCQQIGGADQQKFEDLINKLRRENYIYE